MAFYHGIPVIHGVSLQVGRGDFVSVIGSNGAGKTTLLRSISRLVTVKGYIGFDGKDLTRLKPTDVIKRRIIHCPEGRLLFPNMTVYQNLMMGAYLLHDKEKINSGLERVFEYLPILSKRQTQLAGTLSGGEQQMLVVGRAIMGRPKLLTLDEPSFGLAPLMIDAIIDVIQKLNEEGLTVLLVEQNAALALEFSNFTYVLEEGQIISQGSSRELAEDPAVAKAYLGMT
ncbi:MAG: ABC transporter ATP-binding protein [Deltaproteobacteria bacterium]|nr:ABC transporter ATP-binding protein [Deltaproteobacteria bacterium]MBW1910504.1 ABC transporter ATP-binding protein [Deltaproteobacteria bacterium]MBW2035442.1 ABC transporter ATP-binding protein [Deltaproteobacteria bacterium]MBW2117100.1 ABC transporter ATP-binding protein [Deltaproteobacteria bacterium]